MPPPRGLPRGRRRRTRVDHPGHGPQPRRAHARRARVLGPRAAGTGHDLPARPRVVLVERRDREDVDVHDPRRRGLARRRARDGRRRRVHGRGAQEPGGGRRRGRRLGRRHGRGGRRAGRCGSPSARPSAASSRAATQPLLPAHLLADVPFADLATSDFARLPVGSGPFAITDMDDQRATLVPASGVMAPVDRGSSGDRRCARRRWTRSRRPSRGRAPASPARTSTRSRCGSTTDEAALADGLRERRGGCRVGPVRRASSASSPRRTGIDRLAYPTTTLSTVLLNLRPAHKELRDPKVRAAMLAAIDRDALVSDVLGGNATRADAPRAADVLGVRRGVRRVGRARPQGGREGHAGRRLVEEGRQVGRARRQGRLQARAPHACSPEANPRLASVAAFVRDSWTGVRVRRPTWSRSRPRTSRRRLRSGDFTAAVVDIAEGLEPDLYPLLATSQVRASGSNLAGYQDPALDPLLEAARKPGTPEERDGRVEGAARRAGGPAAPPAPGLERRGHARPRPRRGHPAAHRGHRRPLLGCASMAPRRGPVSPRVGRFQGRAEVAEW